MYTCNVKKIPVPNEGDYHLAYHVVVSDHSGWYEIMLKYCDNGYYAFLEHSIYGKIGSATIKGGRIEDYDMSSSLLHGFEPFEVLWATMKVIGMTPNDFEFEEYEKKYTIVERS